MLLAPCSWLCSMLYFLNRFLHSLPSLLLAPGSLLRMPFYPSLTKPQQDRHTMDLPHEDDSEVDQDIFYKVKPMSLPLFFSLLALSFSAPFSLFRSPLPLLSYSTLLRSKYCTNEQDVKIIVNGKMREVQRLYVSRDKICGGRAVGWIVSDKIKECMICGTGFGVFCWIHHCRACGNLGKKLLPTPFLSRFILNVFSLSFTSIHLHHQRFLVSIRSLLTVFISPHRTYFFPFAAPSTPSSLPNLLHFTISFQYADVSLSLTAHPSPTFPSPFVLSYQFATRAARAPQS
jgi:hypothetical protein